MVDRASRLRSFQNSNQGRDLGYFSCGTGNPIDDFMSSTAITISNNHFAHHHEVMLLGHSDSYIRDKKMQVPIAFNHFGAYLIQRMSRALHSSNTVSPWLFLVLNNDYTHWEMYAIGGSASPTINSQSNRYATPTNPFTKEVFIEGEL